MSGPYVTAVGGTIGANPETAISLSSGGFSNYFPRPRYQDDHVAAYIKNLNGAYEGLYKCGLCLLPFGEPSLKSISLSYYSAQGRGFPDVAARGDWYGVVVGNQGIRVNGTSASTPVRHSQDRYVSHT